MKGISGVLAVMLMLIIGVVAVAGTWGATTYLAAVTRPPVPTDLDGEFDLFVLPSDGNFANSFGVQTACNKSADDDEIGENYGSCIFRSSKAWTNASNSSMQYFSVMIPIEGGGVQDMEIDVSPQTSGTCKPGTTGSSGDEEIFLRNFALYLHEDGQPNSAYRDLNAYVESPDEVDSAKTGYLPEDEYVLVFEWLINTIGNDCVAGDDLYKVELALTSDADDFKDGFILIESS